MPDGALGSFGEVTGEGRPRPRLTLQRDPSAVQFDQGLHESEAETRTTALTSDEPVEDVGLHVKGNAPTCIDHLDLHFAGGASRAQGDLAAPGGSAQGR